MKKKYLVLILFILGIISVIYFNNSLFINKENEGELIFADSANWKLEITGNGKSLLKESNDSNVYYNYNNVMVDMYKVLYYFGKSYSLETPSSITNKASDYNKIIKKISELKFGEKIKKSTYKNEVNIGYRSGAYTDEYNMVKINSNKTITVPDVYYYVYSTKESPVLTNDTVEVDIENNNGNYYLPLYFFSNIPGVKVYLDSKQLYTSGDSYSNSYSALDTSKSTHTIKIEINTNVSNTAKKLSSADNYYGDQNGALWREEALKRIEKYRKNNLTINVKDKNGNVVSNATVKVEMQSNKYLFGTSIPTINGSGVWYGKGENELSSNYFNATRGYNVFRRHLESTDGKYRRDYINGVRKKGVNYVRGHYLFWDRNIGIYRTEVVGCDKCDDTSKCEANPDKELTMYSVYKRYRKLISEGKTETEARKEIDSYVVKLKEKFEKVTMDYVKEMMTDSLYKTIDDWDLFNELYTSKYFQVLLYDEVFLQGNIKPNVNSKTTVCFWHWGDNHLVANYRPHDYDTKAITPNAEYAAFLARMIKTIRNEYKYKGILTFNQNGNNDGAYAIKNNQLVANTKVQSGINLIKAIDKAYYGKTNYSKSSMDVLGFEYGPQNDLYRTPQDYLNESVMMLNATKVPTVNITEFLNSAHDGTWSDFTALKDTDKRKSQKAKFLRDTLIMAYSNQKMSGFVFSGFIVENDNKDYLSGKSSNSLDRFSNEEKKVYKKFINGDYFTDKLNLLKLSKNISYQTSNYTARLYNNSSYKITVTVDGKKYNKTITLDKNQTVDFVVESTSSSSSFTKDTGDVNGDGKIGSTDYILIRKSILGQVNLNDKQKKQADVNSDGKITSVDYILIRKKMLGQI